MCQRSLTQGLEQERRRDELHTCTSVSSQTHKTRDRISYSLPITGAGCEKKLRPWRTEKKIGKLWIHLRQGVFPQVILKFSTDFQFEICRLKSNSKNCGKHSLLQYFKKYFGVRDLIKKNDKILDLLIRKMHLHLYT